MILYDVQYHILTSPFKIGAISPNPTICHFDSLDVSCNMVSPVL